MFCKNFCKLFMCQGVICHVEAEGDTCVPFSASPVSIHFLLLTESVNGPGDVLRLGTSNWRPVSPLCYSSGWMCVFISRLPKVHNGLLVLLILTARLLLEIHSARYLVLSELSLTKHQLILEDKSREGDILCL